jgi:RHS repeat-associated protein
VTSNTTTSITDGFRWVGTNRHGDVTQLLDPLQANPLTGTQSFDPFGQPLSAAIVRIGYQGNWTEPDTKQPWMAARWYQPKTGAFTNRDTLLGEVGGPTVGHNRYSYPKNNPLTYWDPTGRVAYLTDDHRNTTVPAVLGQIAAQAGNAFDSWRGTRSWSPGAVLAGMSPEDVLLGLSILVTADDAQDDRTSRSVELNGSGGYGWSILPLAGAVNFDRALSDQGVSDEDRETAVDSFVQGVILNSLTASGNAPHNEDEAAQMLTLQLENAADNVTLYANASPLYSQFAAKAAGFAASAEHFGAVVGSNRGQLREKFGEQLDNFATMANAMVGILVLMGGGGGRFSVPIDPTGICAAGGCSFHVASTSHSANTSLIGPDGKVISTGHFHSGGYSVPPGTRNTRAMQNASHTEPKAVASNDVENAPKGSTLVITGSRAPCNSCKGVMNRTLATSANLIAIVYKWGGETWDAGTSRAAKKALRSRLGKDPKSKS